MGEVKSLGKIEAFGKGEKKDRPISILGRRGEYFYVRDEHLRRLVKISEASRSTGRMEVEPLEKVTLIGRGGAEGYRPFILPEYPNRYLCIPADQLKRLKEINRAYWRVKAKSKIKEVKKVIGKAKEAGASEKVPDLLKKAEKSFQKMDNELKAENYIKIFEISSNALKIAERARKTALEKIPLGKYVYCIISNPGRRESFGDIGIEGSGETYTLSYRDLAAVVSDAPLKEYKVTETDVRAHNQIITRVMDEYPVVPMAYGMVFKNRKTLRNVMGGIHGELKKALREIGGRKELGLKIITSRGSEFDEEELARGLRLLPEIADLAKKGRKFSERLLLNASYLISDDKIDEFSKIVGELEEKYPQLDFQYSGPWPPFGFVNIKVGGKG